MKTSALGTVAAIFFCAAFALFGARMVLAEDSNPRARLIKVAEETIALLKQREGQQFCWGPFLQTDDVRGKAKIIKIIKTEELLFELVIPNGNESESLVTLIINAAEKQFPLQYGLLQEKEHEKVTKEVVAKVISGTIIVTNFGTRVREEKAGKIYEVLLNTAVGVLSQAKPLIASPDAPFQVPCQ